VKRFVFRPGTIGASEAVFFSPGTVGVSEVFCFQTVHYRRK